jgi:CBS domain-containing protein
MLARELMTAAPHVVTIHETATHAARLMAQYDIGMLPVVDDPIHRRLVGVITDRDLVVRCLSQGHLVGCRIEDHLTRDPLVTVRPDDTLETIVTLMERYQVRRVPVVDDAELHVVGVITLGDLVRHVGRSHPALVERVEERIHAAGALTQ